MIKRQFQDTRFPIYSGLTKLQRASLDGDSCGTFEYGGSRKLPTGAYEHLLVVVNGEIRTEQVIHDDHWWAWVEQQEQELQEVTWNQPSQ